MFDPKELIGKQFFIHNDPQRIHHIVTQTRTIEGGRAGTQMTLVYSDTMHPINCEVIFLAETGKQIDFS
jgi:hypothetical protein